MKINRRAARQLQADLQNNDKKKPKQVQSTTVLLKM